MQTVSPSLRTELDKGLLDPRILVDLYELYPSDYVPGVNGFDPADAIESFAAEEITWDGQAYRRELISRGDIVKNFNEKINQCTLTFSNISRYMATLATTQQIEGLFLVIRCVAPSVTDDSLVEFVGRCDKPSDIDKKIFSDNGRQDFGNINQEMPPREFTAEDPNGRTPSDPLFEGFRLVAIGGSHDIPFQTPSTGFFGRLFGRTKTEYKTQQWSSLDATPYGSVLPLIFGRCQMELIPILFADIGWALIGVWVVGEGRVDDFTNVAVRDSRFTIVTTETHMGDPGGTGTNATNTSGPISQGYLSKTAYVVLSMSGTTVEIVDDAPLITALVKGVRVPLPDSSGVYNQTGWTDNPVHIARFILSDPRLVGINPGFMEDSINYQTSLHCDESLIDDSNGETTLIAQADLPQAGTGIRRSRSTGIIDSKFVRFHLLEEPIDPPEFEPPPFTPFDPGDIPTTFAITRFLRKRYTVNVPLTEKMRAVDFLYKVIFPAAKLFLRINKRGKYEIRTEKPSDATMIRFAIAVGATAIPVLDVTPWKSGPDLLQGRIHLGFSLTTSEVRDVTTADYSADGNSITLATSVTGGGVTSSASGANLTGGSTTVQASGTITVGGTPAAGNTITATINGVAVTYTLTADDSTETTANMLAQYINATPKLRRYIKVGWSSGAPTVITIVALLGVLNVSPALLKTHAAPIVDPTASPVLAASAGALEAGTYKVAYSDITALGKTALSPTASIVLTANQKIDVSALALVGVSRNWYLSDAANSEYLKYAGNTDGSAFSLTALPLPGAALPPQYNTSGEEIIRVAMSFATNSQDVYSVWPASTLVLLTDIFLPTVPNGHKYQVTTGGTTGATEPTWPTSAGGTVASGSAVFTEIGATVLGQAGLTRANIKKDTFSYPLGSRQSSVNQVKISYRDSNNDFARTPYRVNDPIHQAQVNKIYPQEVNGEAIDNFHQMFRIANWSLAKHREGDWFYTFGTGPQGLVLEEGDVICASDDSGGLVNQVCRIEELRIHPSHDVTIGQARKYSTNMFSDDVNADIIPVPTTLRYVQTVDSLIEFIDNHPIRDRDGLTGGFYIAMSRDLTIEGDWRGATLYADYGDGYVEIAERDIPAVVGTATTTLGTVTDPSIWDRTNSVTFTLSYGQPAPAPQPFSTVPEQDILANAHRNLFLVGNEYLQAATVVWNGGQSYTISKFLRGRFGTDSTQLTHGASERVVYLDGSEIFVPISISRLNGTFNYKAVTVNQDVADATAVPFTWTGGNLRPLSPVNLRGTRDAAGNLLIEWNRRDRLGPGLTPGIGTPFSEAEEVYDVEILNGANVVRTVTVRGGAEPAVLRGHRRPELVSGNNVLAPSTLPDAITETVQMLGPNSFIEASLVLNAGGSGILMHIVDPGNADWLASGGVVFGLPFFSSAFFHDNAGFPRLEVSDTSPPGTGYVSPNLGNSIRTVRIRATLTDTGTRYYWDYTGPGSVPFYTSRTIPMFPSVCVITVGGNGTVENIFVGAPWQPSIVYTAEQQVSDWGSLQNPVSVRIYQVSSFVGRGDPATASL